MSLLDMLHITVVEDWLSEVEHGVTVAESIGPALLKVAMDGAAVSGGGPAAIMKLIADIEALIPQIEAAIKANNIEGLAPAPAADATTEAAPAAA